MSQFRYVEVEPGVRLAVRVSGDTEKPVLLFSNSLATSMGMWDETVDRLGADACIVRYDTRGHGESDAPQTGYSIERLGSDLVAIMDALKVHQAVVCGISLGGLIGMWLGIHHPSRVAGLVLANTAASFPPASMWQDRAVTARREGTKSFVVPSLERWLTKPFQEKWPDRTSQLGAMILATSSAGYAGCCETLAAEDLNRDLPRISCPTLVVGGKHDPSVSPARSRELAAVISGATYSELDAAHISPVEAPGAFASSLQKFLSSIKK